MRVTNNLTEYGFISKAFHWLSAAALVVQIPLGFYLVDLDFNETRLTIESIHVVIGLSIFYLTILRLIYKIFNPTPSLGNSIFPGQRFIAKIVHLSMYLLLSLTALSGILIGILYWFGLKNGILIDYVIYVHEFIINLLYLFITIHIFAAIYHRLKRDGVWSSMVPFLKE